MARPRKDKGEQHIDRFAVYLTDKDGDFLRALAARKGIPAGVLARNFVLSQLDKTVATNLSVSLSETHIH